MIPKATATATYRSVPKQHSTRHFPLLVILPFTLFLLVVVVPLFRTAPLPALSNPFRYLLFPPPPSPAVAGTPEKDRTESSTAVSGSTAARTEAGGGCDVYSGEWVRDPEALYYTNTTCSMIQAKRNCLLFGKPGEDFLGWRWRPDGCRLPRFDPRRFLETMRGKSMAFVGDSLAKNHMESLVCILSGVAYPKDIWKTEDEDFKKVLYEDYNFTITVFWSAFLVKTGTPPGRNLNGLWTLTLDEADENWIDDIAGFDYVIVSDGNWLSKQAMLYEGGQLVGCSLCEIPGVPDLTIHHINKMAFRTAFAALNALEGFKGTVILRTISPDHFENGEWDTGGDCTRTGPYDRDGPGLNPHVTKLYETQIEEFRAAAEGRRKGVEYKLMDVTPAMQLRPDGHPSRYAHWPRPNVTFRNDCVHWCLPGPIDLWNEFLYHAIIAV